MDNKSSCKETNLLIETLTEEILKAAQRETEFDYYDESYQYSKFGYFVDAVSPCKEPNALLSYPSFFK